MCIVFFSGINLFFFVDIEKAYSGHAALLWEPPTKNEDGTQLTDLAGYKIYYGTSSGNYSRSIDVGDVTTYTVDNLTDGLTYYFTSTAYDTSGNESKYSNEVSKAMSSSMTPVQQYNLAVYKGGTGTGTVKSSSAGISCGSDCTEAYDAGTVVSLTAIPDESSTFGGWSGACTGTGTCTVTMDASKSVTAMFNIKTYTIKATAGTGGSISPSGNVTVNHGASKTFSISAMIGYQIEDIKVDGTSTGNSYSYTFNNVTDNHSIYVTFLILDTDNDGVPDIEEFGPGANDVNYDGNNDGIPDYMQNTVASLYSFDRTHYLTIFSADGKALTYVEAEQVPDDAPSGLNFPHQTLQFVINNVLPGSNTAVVIKFHGRAFVNDYYKYGPTPDNPVPHWYNFMYDGQTGAEIKGNMITLHFIDGLRGDDDLTVNGLIYDQGGPVRTSTGVPMTGQTVSYAEGDDGYIQAGIEWPDPRFTDNGDGTVTDNLTGLMWLRDGGCIKNNWNDALNSISDFNNNPGRYNCLQYMGNYSDWYLPNVKELESLINYGAQNSATWLNTEGFLNIKSSCYWSSTHWPTAIYTTTAPDKGSRFTKDFYSRKTKNTSQAWLINLYDGGAMPASGLYSYYVLPVRNNTSNAAYELPQTGQTVSYAEGDDGYIQAGIEWPDPRFTDNGDGTVTDNLTGLMWLRDGGCIKNNWNDALNSISDFNNNPGRYNCLQYMGNYSDWYLPNVKELESLINYGAQNSATWLNSESFVNIDSSYYWSSTHWPAATNTGFKIVPNKRTKAQAWLINLYDGRKMSAGGSYTYYVLPVRGGNLIEIQ
ncbi:MAG: DUF1566 domain-containing protein [Nitrospirae bacterium]|nr:DUF1566 domain-containing protein [Nitrospirota bacterium]